MPVSFNIENRPVLHPWALSLGLWKQLIQSFQGFFLLRKQNPYMPCTFKILTHEQMGAVRAQALDVCTHDSFTLPKVMVPTPFRHTLSTASLISPLRGASFPRGTQFLLSCAGSSSISGRPLWSLP